MNVFRPQKQASTFMDLKLVFFQSVFFGCRSRAGLHPEMGINFRCIGVQKWRLDLGRDGFPQVVSGNKRCNKPKQQATGVLLLALPRCPPPRASAITTYRWDRTVMVSATRALPLSSYLRLRHSPSSTTTCLVGDEGSRRLGQNLDR